MFAIDLTEARQQRARQKAREASPVVATVSLGSYRVEGSGGNFYDVTVEGAVANCNCMAGQNDKPCYHAFAAFTKHEVESAVAAPALRDRNLALVESDLRHIMRLAERMTGDWELQEAIFRAARAAKDSLGEYELSLQPAVEADAA